MPWWDDRGSWRIRWSLSKPLLQRSWQMIQVIAPTCLYDQTTSLNARSWTLLMLFDLEFWKMHVFLCVSLRNWWYFGLNSKRAVRHLRHPADTTVGRLYTWSSTSLITRESCWNRMIESLTSLLTNQLAHIFYPSLSPYLPLTQLYLPLTPPHLPLTPILPYPPLTPPHLPPAPHPINNNLHSIGICSRDTITDDS